MRGQRSERLVRLTSKFLSKPSKNISLTELATEFNVSKTVISDDMEVVNCAMEQEGFAHLEVERGRSGGARLLPVCEPEYRKEILEHIAQKLSDHERFLPGGLVYYSDLIFNPEISWALGFAMASLFSLAQPDIIMTTEVKGIPISLFAAHALGCPLAVCRFRNRPSDGSAVAVHYPVANGDVRTMYMGTRQLQKGSRVLILDDFMRGGSTVAGMQLMARQFEANVVGTGLFITAEKPREKAISDYKSLLTLSERNGAMSLAVAQNN